MLRALHAGTNTTLTGTTAALPEPARSTLTPVCQTVEVQSKIRGASRSLRCKSRGTNRLLLCAGGEDAVQA